jgi:sialidase-1
LTPVLISSALACVWSAHALAEPELTHTRLFENHDKVVYRIPALAVSNKGTLLAVCNARVGSPLDNCPYIRLLLRRSTDNGKTWGPVQVLQDRKDWQAVAGAGMVDLTTGEIMFQYTWDPGTDEARKAHQEANKEFDLNSRFTEWIARSTDDGVTWKFEPRKIDLKGYSGCSTVGSDTGIVVRSGKNKGRLLMAARAGIPARSTYAFCRKHGLLMPPPAGNDRVGQNCAIYSDDHGKTWTAGGLVQPETGEGCLCELSDGTIYFNSRTGGGWRLTAMSRDFGDTFGDFATSDALPDCNFGTAASVLSVPKEVHGRHFVLFTNPTYNEFGFSVLRDRKMFTASVSFDDTKTWPLKKLINPGPSGYSASVMSKDGDFFVLYEKGEHHYRDTGVSIVKFNLEWLLDGQALTDF